MRKSRFTETQIVAILERGRCRHEGPRSMPQARDLGRHLLQVEVEVRRHGGLGPEAGRELEAENAKLKRMYADLALENTAMKDLIAKNV